MRSIKTQATTVL